jgi:hypothetical protein
MRCFEITEEHIMLERFVGRRDAVRRYESLLLLACLLCLQLWAPPDARTE